jgi:DNA modification methylase
VWRVLRDGGRRVKPYYDDGQCVIYHGDCREMLPRIEADVLVTDPPYGINYDADWQSRVHGERGTANHATGKIVNDQGEIKSSMFRAYPRRVVFGFPYLADDEATGWLVWDKEPGFKGRSLTSPVEMAYSTTWKGFKAIRLLWSGYLRQPGSEAKLGHPTQKPEALMREILGWSEGTILDPFMGSGTTLRAAKDLGRKAIGIEIEERYCEIAATRLGQEVLDLGEAA